MKRATRLLAALLSMPMIATMAAPAAVAQESTAAASAQAITTQVSNEATTDYLMVYFSDSGVEDDVQEQIYLATSQDATNWTDLRTYGNPALTSNVGCGRVRDPYIVSSPDRSKFWILATDASTYMRNKNIPGCGWRDDGSTHIVIWESTDLVNWSKPRWTDLSSQIPRKAKEGMTWAPEAVWDEEKQQYVIFWATSSDADNEKGNNQNQYYATTKDFITFSKPVKWVDRSSWAIDFTAFKGEDGYWYRSYNNGIIERSKNLYATTTAEVDKSGNTPEDQWAYVMTVPSKLAGASNLEGSEFLRLNTDDYKTVNGKEMRNMMFVDNYGGKGYIPLYSADLGSSDLSNWSAATDVNFGTVKKRHGGFLNITRSEYNAINAAYGDNKFPVKFDSRGGTDVASATFKKGEKIAEPTAPTRDGYDFTGWTTDEAGKEPFDFTKPIDNPIGNIILYAQWKAKPTVQSIAVTAEPTKTEYAIGDKLDTTGLVITATLSDGTSRELTADEYQLSAFDSTKPGTVTISATVPGSDATASFTVTVAEPTVEPNNPDGNKPAGNKQPGANAAGNSTTDGLSRTGSATAGLALVALITVIAGATMTLIKRRRV